MKNLVIIFALFFGLAFTAFATTNPTWKNYGLYAGHSNGQNISTLIDANYNGVVKSSAAKLEIMLAQDHAAFMFKINPQGYFAPMSERHGTHYVISLYGKYTDCVISAYYEDGAIMVKNARDFNTLVNAFKKENIISMTFDNGVKNLNARFTLKGFAAAFNKL